MRLCARKKIHAWKFRLCGPPIWESVGEKGGLYEWRRGGKTMAAKALSQRPRGVVGLGNKMATEGGGGGCS